MARELKPVSFNPDTKADKEMLEYIEELGVSFGSYVKLLIRKDMRAGNTVIETGEIVNEFKELVNILKTGVKNKIENQVNSKDSINSIENKLDYIIDKINEKDDIEISIKR